MKVHREAIKLAVPVGFATMFYLFTQLGLKEMTGEFYAMSFCIGWIFACDYLFDDGKDDE